MVNWIDGKLNEAFLHFFAKFLPYLMIFQSGVQTEGAGKLWKIIKFAKHLYKNEEKPCSTCLQPIFRFHPKIGFRVPIPPLAYISEREFIFIFYLFQEVSIFVFDKKSVDKLHKPKRKEAMTELLKLGLGHLQCYRHPKLLNVIHSPEESPEALAFASEPLIGSLANILNSGLKSEKNCNLGTPQHCLPLRLKSINRVFLKFFY